MEIHLRKIFNIFHRRTVSPAIGVLALLVIMLIVAYSSRNSLYITITWCALFLVPPIWAFRHTCAYPDELIIENRTIKYKEFYRIASKYRRYEHYDATLTVTSYEFRQNFIEKRYNVGHIHFTGYTQTIKGDVCHNAIIYGIPMFDTKREEIEYYLNQQKIESDFENF